LVAIEPCQQCLAPLERMKDAAKALLGA